MSLARSQVQEQVLDLRLKCGVVVKNRDDGLLAVGLGRSGDHVAVELTLEGRLNNRSELFRRGLLSLLNGTENSGLTRVANTTGKCTKSRLVHGGNIDGGALNAHLSTDSKESLLGCHVIGNRSLGLTVSSRVSVVSSVVLVGAERATLSLKLDVVAVGSTVELVVGVVVLLEGLFGELLTRGSKFVLAGLIVVEQPTALRRNMQINLLSGRVGKSRLHLGVGTLSSRLSLSLSGSVRSSLLAIVVSVSVEVLVESLGLLRRSLSGFSAGRATLLSRGLDLGKVQVRGRLVSLVVMNGLNSTNKSRNIKGTRSSSAVGGVGCGDLSGVACNASGRDLSKSAGRFLDGHERGHY